MERIQSVDVIRVAAIISVIAIHTSPFRSNTVEESRFLVDLNFLIDQVARFAVPFFFIISGYFWGVKIRKGTSPIVVSKKAVSRILVIFAVWSAIYLLPYNFLEFRNLGLLGPLKVLYWNIVGMFDSPTTVLLQGTKVHLWFLVSLIMSMIICAYFVSKRWITALVVLALLLYGFGLLAKSYTNTPLGIQTEFNTRNGPFFATLLFVSGYLISGYQNHVKWLQYGLLTFLAGFIIQAIELNFLWNAYRVTPYQDFVIGTYFMGLGAALAALSNHSMLQSESLAKIGQLTLGIYAIHYIFVDLLRPIDDLTNNVLWEIGYVIIVFLLSTILALFLSRLRLLHRIVA